MAPTLNELHKVFPPSEASRNYSHEELLRMYRQLKGETIVPVDNDALMAGYVKGVLRKSGGYLSSSSEKAPIVPKEPKYNMPKFHVKMHSSRSSRKTEESEPKMTWNEPKFHAKMHSSRSSRKTKESEPKMTWNEPKFHAKMHSSRSSRKTKDKEPILSEPRPSGLKSLRDSSSASYSKLMAQLEEAKKAIAEHDAKVAKNKKDLSVYTEVATESGMSSYAGECNAVVKQSKQDLDALIDKHPELEFYPNDSWQHLKALKSYPTIFGMQKPADNCDKLLQFFRFVASKGIRRYACLQCASNEPIVWNVVQKEHEECVFFNHQIQDYQPFTFENAMSILARIEVDAATPIVFHCTAGFGRTGSVMYLILQYMRCLKNRNLLRLPLMKAKTDFTHEEIEKTFLCKEYSFHAAEEFLEAKHDNWRLRTKRLNVINQAVANTLQLYHPQDTEVAYMQIDDIDDLSKQSLQFAKRLPQQVIQNVIELTAAPKRRSSSARRSAKRRSSSVRRSASVKRRASAKRRNRRSSSARRSLLKID